MLSFFTIETFLPLLLIPVITAQSNTICPAIFMPVCGNTPTGGKTFMNDCDAKAQNVTIFVQGECKVNCTMESAPVCGVNGKTYGNRCEADMNGVPVDSSGKYNRDCSAIYPSSAFKAVRSILVAIMPILAL